MSTKKTAVTPTPSTTTKSKAKKLAVHEIAMSPVAQNAIGIFSWSKFAGAADLNELVDDLHRQIEGLKGGDMGSVEAMLFGQAKVLETMFTSLARRAANNDGLKQFQCNLTLALKAQAQCRATLEALAEIKSPRTVAFVKQANMTTGPQQVNNGSTSRDIEKYIPPPTGAEDSASAQNKLLKANHGQCLDTGTQAATTRSHQAMAAMEKVNRTNNGRRKSAG